MELVNPDYLAYDRLSPEQQYKLLGTANGATVAHVNIPTIRELAVTLPDRETQNKIAGIITAYDDLIENNQKQIKLLEEAAQRLYKEWFVDLRFPGHETTTITEGIPEGWYYRRVDEFGIVITGKTPSTTKAEYYDGDIPFVTIPDMHQGIYPLKTERNLSVAGANTQKNKFLPKNAVMVSCIATVGLVSIAVKLCQTNQQIKAVVLYNESDLHYFYEAMKRIRSLLDNVGSNGATMTNVNKAKFCSIEVLYPTTDLLIAYRDFCKPIFDEILVLSKAIADAQDARDRLLPKLMSGELEV